MSSLAKITFSLRLVSTITLWALILATIFLGYELGFFLLIAGVALLGLWEYYKMVEADGIHVSKLTGMTCAVIFMAGSFYYFHRFGIAQSYDLELSVLVLFIVMIFARQMFRSMKDREPLEMMAYTLFGLLWIPWLFNFLTKIVYLPPPTPDGAPTGQFYVLYLIMVTKFSDMGAYVFGSLFGRHPFAPHISPKKTWEGFIGALCTALLASFWLHWMAPEKLSAFSSLDLLILGLLLGFGAVVGDLAESIVKRSTNAKDSSHLLPGIGGVLDLIDSLLFTAPILFFYMRIVLHMP